MAVVLNNQEEDNQNNPQQGQQAANSPIGVGGSQESSTITSGAPTPQGPQAQANKPQAPVTPGQQQAGSSGRFQNLSKFIKANQPGQFGQQFSQKVGQVAQQGKQNIQQAGQQFQGQAQEAGQKLQSIQQNVVGAQNVLSNTAQDNQQFEQGVQQLQSGLGAEYQGPQSLANQDALRFQAQQAGQIGQAAASGAGRAALLQKFFGRSGYNAGQSRLDNMLLSNQADALRKVRQEGRQVGSLLETEQQTAANIAAEKQKQAEAVRAKALEVGGLAQKAQEGALASDAEKYVQSQLGRYSAEALAANAGMANLAGMRIGDKERLALAKKGILGIQGASLNKQQLEDLQKNKDYSSILGKTSNVAQIQAGRFNKLAEAMKADRRVGGDMLQAGKVGADAAKLAALEGGVQARGLEQAEELQKQALAQAQEDMFQQKINETARKHADYYENKRKMGQSTSMGGYDPYSGTYNNVNVVPKTDPKLVSKDNPFGFVDNSKQIRDEYLKREVARLQDKGTADDEWAAAQDYGRQLADRSTEEGQKFYQKQLKQANREALNRLLGIK